MSVSKLSKEVDGSLYRVRLLETKKLDLNLDLTFDYTTAVSQVYMTPLSPERKTYFATLKKPGLQLSGKYSHQGKEYECNKDGSKACLMIIDIGRTT